MGIVVYRILLHIITVKSKYISTDFTTNKAKLNSRLEMIWNEKAFV